MRFYDVFINHAALGLNIVDNSILLKCPNGLPCKLTHPLSGLGENDKCGEIKELMS